MFWSVLGVFDESRNFVEDCVLAYFFQDPSDSLNTQIHEPRTLRLSQAASRVKYLLWGLMPKTSTCSIEAVSNLSILFLGVPSYTSMIHQHY